jgi:hypothetical protein
LSSEVNCGYYGSTSCTFIEVDDFRVQEDSWILYE